MRYVYGMLSTVLIFRCFGVLELWLRFCGPKGSFKENYKYIVVLMALYKLSPMMLSRTHSHWQSFPNIWILRAMMLGEETIPVLGVILVKLFNLWVSEDEGTS